MGIRERIELVRSAHWVTVPFKILEVTKDQGGGDGSPGDLRFDCRYAYVFAGKQYTGTRVRISGQGSQSEEYAALYDQAVRCRETGESTHGWVNPANPDESVLSRESPRDMNLRIFGGAAFLVGSCLFLFLAWTTHRRRLE